MPYSQPSRSSSPSRSYHSHSHQIQNHSTSTHSLGRPGHRRSYSSQAHYGSDSSSQQSTTSTLSKSSLTGTASTRFSNEQSIDGKNGTRGAWGSLGSLPRRHSSGTTLTLNSTSKFRIGDRRESSSSDDDNENDDEHQQNLPPLKFKVQVLPSFSEGVPFPKSSADSPVRMGPMSIPNPANVTMTRSSAPTRTTSSPAMITLEAPSTPAASPAVILLSTGKPLRSSLKGSRVSSLLNSPMGSAANSPSISPVNSVRSSPANSTVTSPITSPGIAGPSAPSFASFANFNTDSTAKLLAPPSFNGHVRAQSAPSPPTTPGQGIEEVLESTWTAPISPTSEAPLSPGVSEPMPPDALLSPRSVHFPSLPTDLERIRVFRKEARPSSLLVTRKERDQITSSLNHVSNLSNGADGAEGSGTDAKSGGEETETETETDREYGYGYNAGYWGTWGGRGLWDAAASSRSNESSSMKVSSDQPTISTGAFPFPRLPRLGRTRSAGGKDEDGGESSSSSSSSGGRIRIRNTGTGPRFARKEEEKEQVGNSDKRLTKKVKVELDVPSSVCHVPRPESVRDALSGSVNIFLEELHLENSSSEPFALEGTFLVRNITFEKNVFVRFTTDDWSTVNEVRGKWVDSCGRSRLISLGSKSSFGINVPRTLGDLIVVPDYTYTVDENSSEWDRFTFRINLPPAPALRPGRIVEFVGKFVVGNAGGEWWDNCGGRNWRIGFKEVEIIEAPGSSTVIPKASVSPPASNPNATSSSVTSDIPASVIDVAANPTISDTTPDHAYNSESHVALPAEYSIPPHTSPILLASETKAEAAASIDEETSGPIQTIKEVKERAPKPTGLGSLSGLGGLFWPWRNTTNLNSQKSAFSNSAASGPGSAEILDPLSPRSSSLAAETSSSNVSSNSSNWNSNSGRNLPASATVEVLSIIPPSASKDPLTKITSTSNPSPHLLFPKFERERISSVSSVSSTESVDSMIEVPLLERSSSLSSVSTDEEFAEMAALTHDMGDTELKLDLTPVPKDLRKTWLTNDDSIGEDESGFFDHTGPEVGGFGIASPSTGADKPLDTDPLYKAFVQQWCFAGTGSGSPAASDSSIHTPNRNRLQVM